MKMVEGLSYKTVQRILTSWVLASQKYGSREEIGLKVLLLMFRKDPDSKAVFGFTANQNIEGNTMIKMGVMVHGTRIYSMLDQTIGLIGPDIDSMIEFLETLGEKHTKLGVSKKHFAIFSDCIREVMATILEDKFSPDDDVAWRETMDFLSTHITKNM